MNIFEDVRRDLATAEHRIANLTHHPRYHHHNNAPQEAPVDLATIENDVRGAVQDVIGHAEAAIERGKQLLDTHLPALAQAAERAQASPVAQALEEFILGPEDEALVAGFIRRLGTMAAQDQAAMPEAAPAEQPEPAPVPTGPVVGGQA